MTIIYNYVVVYGFKTRLVQLLICWCCLPKALRDRSEKSIWAAAASRMWNLHARRCS